MQYFSADEGDDEYTVCALHTRHTMLPDRSTDWCGRNYATDQDRADRAWPNGTCYIPLPGALRPPGNPGCSGSREQWQWANRHKHQTICEVCWVQRWEPRNNRKWMNGPDHSKSFYPIASYISLHKYIEKFKTQVRFMSTPRSIDNNTMRSPSSARLALNCINLSD